MVDFTAMSRADAKAYLQQFLAEMPASQARLGELLQAVGADPGLAQERTPESLEPVWLAVRPTFAWQPGYQPPTLGMPGPSGDPAGLGPPESLPSWFTHPSGAGYSDFSRETLWAIDGVSRHLAQVVLAIVPGTKWAAGNNRRKGYIFQNRPVITGLGKEFSPVHTTTILVGRVLRALPHAPQTTRELFDSLTGT